MSAQPDHTIISLFWLLLLPKALTDVRNISLPVSQMYKKKERAGCCEAYAKAAKRVECKSWTQCAIYIYR